jgi:hypothetical protein
MRYISCAILFAVFAILFQSVASKIAAKPAPKASVSVHQAAANSLRKAQDLLEQAETCTNRRRKVQMEAQAARYKRQAMLHVKGSKGEEESAATHMDEARKHDSAEARYRARANEAKTDEDKAHWLSMAKNRKAWAETRRLLARQ